MSAQPGFKAHVSTLGSGPRRALALHCTMAHGGAWGGVAKVLGDRMTLIAPDMPSHGQSADWDGSSDFSQTVFEASMAALDPVPMDVIGHSFGAATALRMVVEHPDRIRSLTLFEPVFFAAGIAEAPDIAADDNRNLEQMEQALREQDYIAAARAFSGMWSDGAVWDALPERSRKAMARGVHVVPETRPFLYDDTAGLLNAGRMEAVTVPTLLMRGAQTLPVVMATNKGLARRLGQVEEVIIDGAGHMAPLSHPVDVARAIGALLDRS